MAAPTLSELAEAALKILARDGAPVEAAANSDDSGWQITVEEPGHAALDISLAGPDIPVTCDEDLAPPSLIARERPWKGKYRLAIRAPVIVFDIYWSPGEPLRVMTFSRGDWERDLLAQAG